MRIICEYTFVHKICSFDTYYLVNKLVKSFAIVRFGKRIYEATPSPSLVKVGGGASF